jgi:endoglycosylceramidase
VRPRVLALLVGVLLLAPATAGAQISHDGRWLTDSHGRALILHGVNMVSKRAPYVPDATGFGADDARFLARNGFNTVRLGLIYAAVEPQPGVYDDAYLDRIAKTVDELGRQGIAVLLDFHQDLYNERFQGEGWPDWAVLDDGLPAEPKNGFPRNYVGMPALNAAFDHFWNNTDGLQDHYAAAWAHVAQRFGDHPAVLGYDLLNEPWPGNAWQACAQGDGCFDFDTKLTAFYARTTEAIRAVDPSTLVFVEPNVLANSGARSQLQAFGDGNVGLSFHDYCAAAERATCLPLDDKVFQQAETVAKRFDGPALLTEFGATTDLQVLTDMADRADRFQVGWQEWHYCGCDDPTTTGPGTTQALVYDPAKPPRGRNVATGKLRALARAYPQAIAGTPRRSDFDPKPRVLTVSWTPTRREDTRIATPELQYPHGYVVHVSGGVVRSKPGATVLRIAAKKGATAVRVRVAPR